MSVNLQDFIRDVNSVAFNPLLAHSFLFEHRRRDPSPPFHADMITLWRSSERKVLFLVFRGGAKSTLAEEAIATEAATGAFHNCLIVGANLDRACDRLRAVRHELETNERLEDLLGPFPGPTWTDSKLILSNGVMVQALGQGQDLRGVKHLDWRPDLVVIDDVERREDALTPAARKKMRQWFFGELVPAVDPTARFRANGTPLDDDALIVALAKLEDWKVFECPIRYKGEAGEWVPAWSERFPLEYIDSLERELAAIGELDIFEREYMVRARPGHVATFRHEHFKFENCDRTYEATYAMYDPARTVNKDTSAHTGKVVWSWRNNRLLIWESGGYFWRPSDIIDDMYDVDRRFAPVWIGVERDGLEEFILQPLRQEAVKRSNPLPIRDVKAPRSKLDFIKALEPFSRAGELVFIGGETAHATLVQQLLNFPTGRIDVPNALAYAPRLRPGLPMIADFTDDNVDEVELSPRRAAFLAMNATPALTAAALVQIHEGRVSVAADWIQEGDPGETVPHIVQAARLHALGQPFKIVLPVRHFSDYDSIGLRAAVRSLPLTPHRGGSESAGRLAVRTAVRERIQGRPAFIIDPAASWTIRAFAGGYARAVVKDGRLDDEPIDNHYSVLVASLEALTGLSSFHNTDGDDRASRRFDTAPDGRRYLSARG